MTLRAHLYHLGETEEQQQPAGTYGRAILSRLLIDLSWASSRLEGNTYSRLDTERLIAQGQYAEGKGTQEAQMILNHKAAIELLIRHSALDKLFFHLFVKSFAVFIKSMMFHHFIIFY